MSERGGFLIHLDEPLREMIIRNRLDQGGTFSDTFSVPDWPFKSKEIGLVTFDGTSLEGAFLLTKGKKVATYKARVEFSAWIPFDPLLISKIEQGRLRTYFLRASSGSGKRITPKTWEHAWAIILNARPNANKKLKALLQLRDAMPEQFSESSYEILREERDAAGLALSVFGLDRKNEFGQILSIEERGNVAPFMSGLSRVKMREDGMINHDAAVIPGWQQISRYMIGCVTFAQGNQTLTIASVNRQPMEATLGVDLIYYHHRFRSFVLVQYKRLTKENGGNTWKYRPENDRNFEAEIARMRKFEKPYFKQPPSKQHEDYRLHSQGFYFKFAPAVTYDPLSTDLIPGMYIPLDLWTEMEELNALQGIHGGKVLTFTDYQRYLNNSEFITLLKGGWIGTRLSETDVLLELIRAGLENDRSVYVAVEHD